MKAGRGVRASLHVFDQPFDGVEMVEFTGAAGAPVDGSGVAGAAAGGAQGSMTSSFVGGRYLFTGPGMSEGAGGMASSNVPAYARK